MYSSSWVGHVGIPTWTWKRPFNPTVFGSSLRHHSLMIFNQNQIIGFTDHLPILMRLTSDHRHNVAISKVDCGMYIKACLAQIFDWNLHFVCGTYQLPRLKKKKGKKIERDLRKHKFNIDWRHYIKQQHRILLAK